MRLYVVVLSYESCCEYADMEVLVTGISDTDAKRNAIEAFVNEFKVRPDNIAIVSSFDTEDIKLNFVESISAHSGSK